MSPSLRLAQSLFVVAVVVAIGNDDVIGKVDVHQLAGIDDADG